MFPRIIFVSTAMLFLLSAAACSSDTEQFLPTIEIDPTVTEKSRSENILLHPAATRTGMEELDIIIEAILANDINQRLGLVQFIELSCTTKDGLGGPPKCEPGELQGTILEVFPILGGEGHHSRRDSIDQSLSFTVSGLYAVYRLPEDTWQDESYPAGDYGLVFLLADNGMPITVQVKDGRIVRLDYAFGNPEDVIQGKAGEFILPPVSAQD